MGKTKRSWELGKACISLLKQNKKFLLFPLCSGLSSIFILLSLALPLLVAFMAHFHWNWKLMAKTFDSFPSHSISHSWFYWAALIVLCFWGYFINYFIMYFFNTGLVYSILRHLEGKATTIQSALGFSWGRRGVIFRFSLLSATVGVLLFLLESLTDKIPGGFLKRLPLLIAEWFVGAAWTLGTFFVIPVLVFEEQDVKTSLKRSLEIFKKMWGETIAAKIGFSVIFNILVILFFAVWSVVLVLIGIGMMNHGGLGLGLALVGWFLLLFLFVGLLSLISSVLAVIYQTVAYSYSVTGVLPQEFPTWAFNKSSTNKETEKR